MDTPISSDTPSAAAPRCWFYGAAVFLMLVGVAAAFVQKEHEGNVSFTEAKRFASGVQTADEHQNAVQRIIRDAERWQMLSLAAVFLAIMSWGVAVGRRENCRGAWMVVVCFLALYILLELMMV